MPQAKAVSQEQEQEQEQGAETSATESAILAALETLNKLLADSDSRGAHQVGRAIMLEQERATMAERIDANRKYLRLMDQNEELTEEQGEWLDAWYPLKEKGERRSEDEIKRTAAFKAAAIRLAKS